MSLCLQEVDEAWKNSTIVPGDGASFSTRSEGVCRGESALTGAVACAIMRTAFHCQLPPNFALLTYWQER